LEGVIEERSALPADLQGALARIDSLEEEVREYAASETGRFYAARNMEWLREAQKENERLQRLCEPQQLIDLRAENERLTGELKQMGEIIDAVETVEKMLTECYDAFVLDTPEWEQLMKLIK
jgi:hypothetical protein